MHFTNIYNSLLFVPLAAYVVWYILKGQRLSPAMKVSTTLPFAGNIKSYRNYLVHVPFALRVIAMAMLILVMMRPVSTNRWSEESVEGIDIMLAMDVSTSMSATDIHPKVFLSQVLTL